MPEIIKLERRLEERVAILETKADSHSEKLDQNFDLVSRFIARLDSHIELENEHDNKVENTLTRVTTVVDNLTTEISRTNATIERFIDKVESTSTTVIQYDTIAKTIVKIVGIVAVLVGAGWAVYTFAVDHPISINYEAPTNNTTK
jgi:ABC-type transporter Mla subunit MlaD